MAQPHLRPHHLVKLLQTAERSKPVLRSPEWLAGLLDRVCDHIEPVEGEARVGYDLHYQDPAWQLDLFLGRTEIVGGNLDGCSDCVSFTADIPGILSVFSKVERCQWLALPSSLDTAVDETDARLSIEGVWEDHSICVNLRAVPPSAAAPGLRRYPDGRYELT